MKFAPVATGMIAALALSGPAMADSEAEKPAIISVTGTGIVNVAPDMALVSVGVVREAKTARAALDANNKAMRGVLAAMEKEGIAKKDLQTSGFSIQPRYVYPKQSSNGERKPPKIVGYVVSNNLDITILDLEKTGEILDLVVTLGVNSGGNIRFSNNDKTEHLEKARIKAVEDAMQKAKVLTTTAGAELGRLVSISENQAVPRPVPMVQARAMAAEDAAASVPIAGGENAYRINVNISWEIEQ